MKIKQAVIYRSKDLRNAILTFYLIILACYVFFSILGSLESVHMSSMNGLEMATIMFLLVTGLFSFKSSFYLFLQNGVSRKTMFFSYLISMLVASSVMALIDSVAYTLIETEYGINSLFEQVYGNVYEDQLIVKIFVTFAWSLSAYFAFSIIGFFISILFYRMNKTLKIIISVAVPCLLFIVLPIMDSYYNGQITLFIGKCFNFFFGTGEQSNPLVSVITCSCLSILLAGLSFCFVKKAVIKKS